jgi:hypothetical protein
LKLNNYKLKEKIINNHFVKGLASPNTKRASLAGYKMQEW